MQYAGQSQDKHVVTDLIITFVSLYWLPIRNESSFHLDEKKFPRFWKLICVVHPWSVHGKLIKLSFRFIHKLLILIFKKIKVCWGPSALWLQQYAEMLQCKSVYFFVFFTALVKYVCDGPITSLFVFFYSVTCTHDLGNVWNDRPHWKVWLILKLVVFSNIVYEASAWSVNIY